MDCGSDGGAGPGGPDGGWVSERRGRGWRRLRVDAATIDGWLVSAYEMSHDMTSAEMHPDGAEFHFLVSGRLDLVLEEDPGNRVVELTAGSSTAVARGVWHRFVVREPAVGLAVTFGRGTQHRPARS